MRVDGRPISIPGARTLAMTTYQCGCVNVAIDDARPLMHPCPAHFWTGVYQPPS